MFVAFRFFEQEYVGERLDDGKRDGFGRSILSNRDQYEGEYKMGRRHGTGCYMFKNNGARYSGEWKRGMKHGCGKFNYPDGSVYCGQWKNNKKHGSGKYTYRNGDTFDGMWKENVKHGVGVYTFQEVCISFRTLWVENAPKGPIEIFYPHFRYHGYVTENNLVGNGVYSFNMKYMQIGHNENYPEENSVQDDDIDDGGSKNHEFQLPNESEQIKDKLSTRFIAHRILPYNYSCLPQHPFPPPQTDSEISLCTDSSKSEAEIHLYQVQSPILIEANPIEGEDDVYIGETEDVDEE
jgi:radial spoke head protein 1